MEINSSLLKSDERAAFNLRGLYQKYGYIRYKMGKFEEYDLYMKNKDFLVSKGIITFTDTSGRLMALKPDVTLSIIKNFQPRPGHMQKVYYNENVYRISGGTHAYKEIMQTGLECMGDVDLYDICETVLLAVLSLKTVSARCAVDVSHMGILSAVLEACAVPAPAQEKLITCLGQKNIHGIQAVCEEDGLDRAVCETLCALCRLYAPLGEALRQLREICAGFDIGRAAGELEAVAAVLADAGCGDQVYLDFSIVNDMKYYSGITMNGFIEGIPGSVLSGGVYDRLMKKMGKDGRGVGFAVYLDQLERYGQTEKKYDVDTVLLYEAGTDPRRVAEAVRALTAAGSSVLAQRDVPQQLRYRRLAALRGGEVTCLEDNG